MEVLDVYTPEIKTWNVLSLDHHIGDGHQNKGLASGLVFNANRDAGSVYFNFGFGVQKFNDVTDDKVADCSVVQVVKLNNDGLVFSIEFLCGVAQMMLENCFKLFVYNSQNNDARSIRLQRFTPEEIRESVEMAINDFVESNPRH